MARNRTCLLCARKDDLHDVYHGRIEPATGCGFHARYFRTELATAHNRLEA